MRLAANVLLKLPLYHSLYRFGFPRVLPLNYTFSLTFKCNSRCQTCNIWRKRSSDELRLEEWEKVFRSLGKSPFWVTISGGEPFLRPDLLEICQSLYQICEPRIINIPTNGLLTEKIIEKAGELIKNSPKTKIVINLSLDGVRENHDQIRGVKGNFKKAMKTYGDLRKIDACNFSLGVHTVISKENAEDFPALCDFVLSELKPDSYITEIAEQRAELETLSTDITPGVEDYRKVIGYLDRRAIVKSTTSVILNLFQDLGAKMLKRVQHDKEFESGKGFPRLIQSFRSTYYDLVIQTLGRKTQIIPCFAGIASAQIAPNGDVWPCCVRADVLGNFRESDYNFKKIWFSEKADKVIRSIKNKECHCPLANVSYTNILLSPRAMGKVGFRFFKL